MLLEPEEAEESLATLHIHEGWAEAKRYSVLPPKWNTPQCFSYHVKPSSLTILGAPGCLPVCCSPGTCSVGVIYSASHSRVRSAGETDLNKGSGICHSYRHLARVFHLEIWTDNQGSPDILGKLQDEKQNADPIYIKSEDPVKSYLKESIIMMLCQWFVKGCQLFKKSDQMNLHHQPDNK